MYAQTYIHISYTYTYTHRQTERHTDRYFDRQIGRQTQHTWTDRHAGTRAGRQTGTVAGRQTGKHTETDTQTDRWTDKLTGGRQAEKQINLLKITVTTSFVILNVFLQTNNKFEIIHIIAIYMRPPGPHGVGGTCGGLDSCL